MKLYSKNTQCPFSSFPMNPREGGEQSTERKRYVRSLRECAPPTKRLKRRVCASTCSQEPACRWLLREETQQHAENRCTTEKERSGHRSSVNVSPQQMHLKTRPARPRGRLLPPAKTPFASHCPSNNNNTLKCTVSRI